MVSEHFSELMKLIMGPYSSRLGVVKILLDDLDVIVEDDNRIAGLYLMVSREQKSATRLLVESLYDAESKEGSKQLIQVPEEVGEITVSDPHRNEQVNIAALCKGLQTILCSSLSSSKYYALAPQKGDSYRFELSSEGEGYQYQIRRKYGSKLERFPRSGAKRSSRTGYRLDTGETRTDPE